MAYVTSLRNTVVFVFLALDAAMLSNGYWTRWFHLQEDFIDEKKTLDEIHTAFPRLVCDNPSSSTEYICIDSLEEGEPCKSYKIRFCCPGKHGTDTCVSDEELSKHRILYNSSIVIEENVSIGSSVFWFEEWNISSPNLFLGIVDGNQFNRFCVREDNTSIVVADLIDATITEAFFLVIHSLTEEHETLAFGLEVHVIDREDWPPYYNKTCEIPIKDRNLWPLMIDISFENKRVSEYYDVSKQFRIVANNSACALSIYYAVALDRVVFKSVIDYFGTKGNLSFDGVSWLVNFVDQDYKEVINFNGGSSSHFKSEVFKVNYTDPNQIQIVKQLGEYMLSEYIGKVTIKMVDTHVRQKYLIALQREKTRFVGTIEPIYVGCPFGKYGGECQYDCLCKNSATCHTWNGACLCGEGWRGPTCDIPMEPSAKLTISKERVTYYSSVRLQCSFYNIYNIPLVYELNGRRLFGNDTVAFNSHMVGGLSQLNIANMTEDFEGTYRCIVFSPDPNIYAVSNFLNVSIQGCQNGMWGAHCERQCNCSHSNNCTRYAGCVCKIGWTGPKCDMSIKGIRNNQLAISISIVILLVISIGGIGVFLILRRHRRRTKRSETNYTPLADVNVFRDKQLVVGHLIGQGEFSVVHCGSLKVNNETRNVAVKILTSNLGLDSRYWREIHNLIDLGDCPYIVQIIGVVTLSGRKSIVMELMRDDMHSVLKYLLGKCNYSEVTSSRLMKFCRHVSLGLQYMETVKVIHRDIAARNVLISYDDVAKIGDFGSAKDVYETLTYKESPSKRGQKVPLGWMAPESLADGVYTHVSDMWSYGVFLWEAATLGGTPYHNINSADIPQRLQEGYRLPKPQHCSEEFYNLMLRCWTKNPQERLTASKAVDILDEMFTREDMRIFHV